MKIILKEILFVWKLTKKVFKKLWEVDKKIGSNFPIFYFYLKNSWQINFYEYIYLYKKLYLLY